jgi:hypothetical protein
MVAAASPIVAPRAMASQSSCFLLRSSVRLRPPGMAWVNMARTSSRGELLITTAYGRRRFTFKEKVGGNEPARCAKVHEVDLWDGFAAEQEPIDVAGCGWKADGLPRTANPSYELSRNAATVNSPGRKPLVKSQ